MDGRTIDHGDIEKLRTSARDHEEEEEDEAQGNSTFIPSRNGIESEKINAIIVILPSFHYCQYFNE